MIMKQVIQSSVYLQLIKEIITLGAQFHKARFPPPRSAKLYARAPKPPLKKIQTTVRNNIFSLKYLASNFILQKFSIKSPAKRKPYISRFYTDPRIHNIHKTTRERTTFAHYTRVFTGRFEIRSPAENKLTKFCALYTRLGDSRFNEVIPDTLAPHARSETFLFAALLCCRHERVFNSIFRSYTSARSPRASFQSSQFTADSLFPFYPRIFFLVSVAR